MESGFSCRSDRMQPLHGQSSRTDKAEQASEHEAWQAFVVQLTPLAAPSAQVWRQVVSLSLPAGFPVVQALLVVGGHSSHHVGSVRHQLATSLERRAHSVFGHFGGEVLQPTERGRFRRAAAPILDRSCVSGARCHHV